ncbi:MAG: hypothetical protein ACK502_09385 [Alphaproteobacteria bacterium]
MALAEPVTLKVERNQNITIRADGSVLVGVHDIGQRITKDNTLIITGSGAGSKIDIDPKWAPLITLSTTDPLLIKGSFTLSAQSTQSALVDVTPVELTGMAGVESKKTVANPDKTAMATQPKVTKYDLSTPDGKLSENAKTGAKSFSYSSSGAKRQLFVERGARVDFINSRDNNRQLFTLLGSDAIGASENRFRIARGDAMADVQRTLDIYSPLSAGQLAREKEKYGIPAGQARGVVELKNPGKVDLSVSAVLPYGVDSLTPATGTSTGRSATVENETAEDTPQQKLSAQKAVQGFAQRHLNNSAIQAIMSGKYAGDVKGGKALKGMFENINAQASQMLNSDGTAVSKPHLVELHKELAKFEDAIDRMTGEAVDSLKKNKLIPAGKENDPSAWKKENVPGWLYDRMQDMKKEVTNVQEQLEKTPSLSRKAAYTGKIGMLDLVPKDMPKLAVFEATEAPAPLAAAMPRIANFLKGKSGGQGAA